MGRRGVATTGVAVALTLLAAACGSTKVTGGGPTASASGSTVCATKDVKPGYTNAIADVAGGAKSLSGAGATFPAPVISVWTKNYSQDKGVQVAYQSIGSGGGIAQLQAQTVDFGQSDVPMTVSETAAAKGGPVLHVPIVLGAVVVTYKVQGLQTGLKLDGETIGKIFAGQITTWKDPAITGLNPGLTIPDEPIAVVHRSDGSGTTAIFTDYLTKASPSWVTKLGGKERSAGKTVAWPGGIGGKGNEGVSGAVGQTEGAIGYVELQYALSQSLPFADVKNIAGNFIEPCVASVTKAVEGVSFPADLKTSLTDSSNPQGYPIAGTSYSLIYEKQTDPAKAAALVNFYSWVLTKGQDQVGTVNYAPLGSDLQKQSIAQLKKITLNGQPVAK